jgi:hypothetical protein
MNNYFSKFLALGSLILFLSLLLGTLVFGSLVLISILIVPLTFIYSLIVGQSYNFTIDQSNILYKLNIFGQWSLAITGSIFLFDLVFLKSTLFSCFINLL